MYVCVRLCASVCECVHVYVVHFGRNYNIRPCVAENNLRIQNEFKELCGFTVDQP